MDHQRQQSKKKKKKKKSAIKYKIVENVRL